MTILLAKELLVVLFVEVLLGTSGFTLVQSSDVVFLPHFITVESTECGSKTADSREVKDGGVSDAIVRLASESRADLSVDDARAAVG